MYSYILHSFLVASSARKHHGWGVPGFLKWTWILIFDFGFGMELAGWILVGPFDGSGLGSSSVD
jgi:hypothetical protein